MSINYFIPNIRSSPTEINSKLNAMEERKSRLDKAKDTLEKEYREYTLQTYQAPDQESILKQKNVYNSLCFSNTKKLNLLKDLKNKISLLTVSRSDSSEKNPKSLSNSALRSPNFESSETRIFNKKDQIKAIEKDTEKEKFITQQLEKMKENEKNELSSLLKNIKESQGFYNHFSKYDEKVEEMKFKAEYDKIHAFENFAFEKKKIQKTKQGREKLLFSTRQKEANLFKTLKYMQKKVIDDKLLVEDKQIMKVNIVRDLESALSVYDNNKTIQSSYADELNYYSIGYEKIKSVLKGSSSFNIPEDLLENITLEEILKIFEKFQTFENHLQIKFNNLTVAHSLLDEKLAKLKTELKKTKAEESVALQLDFIKKHAENLNLEEKTYTGLRTNLDSNLSFHEESIEQNEKMAIFLLKYILEISFRLTNQLNFIKTHSQGHPKILELYLGHISRIIKEFQHGFIVKIKAKKRHTPVNHETNRRQSNSKTVAVKFQDFNDFSDLIFEKFKSSTQQELTNAYLKEFPKKFQNADIFAKAIYFNNLNKHFISQNDLKKFLKECRNTADELIQNIRKLFLIPHKNLKKISGLSIDIITEILKKIKISENEIRTCIKSIKFDDHKKRKLFLKLVESGSQQNHIEDDPNVLLKTIFEYKLKVIDQENKFKSMDLEFNRFLSKISLAEVSKKNTENEESEINYQNIGKMKPSLVSSPKSPHDILIEVISKKPLKQRPHAQTYKVLPKIHDKKEVSNDIKKIQSGIDMIKKGNAFFKYDPSRESSPTWENFPIFQSPVKKKQLFN